MQFRKHVRGFSLSTVIGIVVFLLSELLLYLGVSVLGMNALWTYLVQAIISVEVSFVLNWRFTFKRATTFWQSCWKYSLSRGASIPVNQGLFSGLIWIGMPYLTANVITVLLFSIVNYGVSIAWTFRPQTSMGTPIHAAAHTASGPYPMIGVVIPVKRSERTILACVDSLLAQDYAGAYQIILVGDMDDSTWLPLAGHIASRRITVMEVDMHCAGRDANAKRNIGLDHAREIGCEVLVLTDSDMVLSRDWLSKGIEKISLGYDCVAGSMESVSKGFWATYVDRNPLLYKTPRMIPDYVVTKRNYGKKKPPISANAFFTADVYTMSGGLDPDFIRTYDDYEFFEKIVRGGVDILCTHDLVGGHNHREGLRTLMKDYVAAGWGCADFIVSHPQSSLTKQRTWQLRTLFALSIIFLGMIPSAVFLPDVWLAFVAVGAVGPFVQAYCAVKARTWQGLIYPYVTAVFMVEFIRGYIQGRNHNKKPSLARTRVNHVSFLQNVPEEA